MKTLIYSILCVFVTAVLGCDTRERAKASEFPGYVQRYYDGYLKLFPLEATNNGDPRFNHLLPATFTDSYGKLIRDFYTRYNDTLQLFDRNTLSGQDALSYDVLQFNFEVGLRGIGLKINDRSFADHNYTPFDQFNSVPLMLAQMGAGGNIQPFKTPRDHEQWLQRAAAFSPWADSAIRYFRKGMDSAVVLPKILVTRMIPQLRQIASAQAEDNIFYGPVKLLPDTLPEAEKAKWRAAYLNLIGTHIVPSYNRLADFLEKEYLPLARSAPGILGLPDGKLQYNYLVKCYTTMRRSGGQYYYMGLNEVKRIREEMERVKDTVGFKGTLTEFFEHLRNDKKLMPYKTPEQVLNAFRDIKKKIEPNVNRLFRHQPKTPFEIRQTEAYRAATASAEYVAGLPDGSRPGIFYIPIIDAKTFNIASGMESLFLHEAIPGHHFQVSLQNENTMLPDFRKFYWLSAYGEGYALYCESLGRELGLYTDPYQYMGALNDEMHRALRLVIDAGIHDERLTREEAIRYMMENESISEQGAIAEVERYMAIPGQALSYKAGAMKIRELRDKYEKELGPAFNIQDFHEELLKDGCLPMRVLEVKMDKWATGLRARP